MRLNPRIIICWFEIIIPMSTSAIPPVKVKVPYESTSSHLTGAPTLMRLTSATVCSNVYLLLDSTANFARTGSLIIATNSLACIAWNSSRFKPF